MMKLIIILSALIAVQGRSATNKDPSCDGIKINGLYYESEILKDEIDRPYLLAVDYSSNNLYFSYNIKEDQDEYKSARLNLNTKEFSNIDGINNGFAQTVDQEMHEIYIGGSDGIYKYDYGTNKAEMVAEQNSDIWTLYFNKVLYYVVFPTQFLYMLVDGESRRFPDLEDTKVFQFAIDKDFDIFFTNATGLFSQKLGSKNATLYAETQLRSLTTDKNGNVYAALHDGVYSVNKETASLEKIIELDDGFGLTFDNDNNFVYSEANKLVRLKVNKKCN